jgi:hypothetical protein
MNWLVFITDTEYVYCAVRSGSLYVIQVNLSLHTAKKPSNPSFLQDSEVKKNWEKSALR